MSGNLRLYNSGGYVELQAPSNATSQTLVLPTDSIQPGLVHIATESFSGVSNIRIDNIFSNQYKNYLINFSANPNGNGTMGMRLSSNGIPDTASNYRSGGIYSIYSTSTVNVTNYNNIGYWGFGYQAGQPAEFSRSIYVMNPFESSVTTMSSAGANYDATSIYTGVHIAASSYDGIYFFMTMAGLMSGQISVYGYRNA